MISESTLVILLLLLHDVLHPWNGFHFLQNPLLNGKKRGQKGSNNSLPIAFRRHNIYVHRLGNSVRSNLLTIGTKSP